MIPIDGRLKACADFVSEGGKICDVGTDHAYLVAYLVSSGKCCSAIAADINEGPLMAARQTLEKYGVLEKVSVIKSNGLDSVPIENITDVVIAGMGAELIADIVSKAEWLKNGVNLVVQPMTHIPYLRKWLYENGYKIETEKAVKNEKFIYSIMKVSYSGVNTEIDQVFENIGKMDLTDDTARLFALKQVDRLEKAGKGIQKSTNTSTNSMLETAKKIKILLQK